MSHWYGVEVKVDGLDTEVHLKLSKQYSNEKVSRNGEKQGNFCQEWLTKRPVGREFNSHPGHRFSLSLCGPNSISRPNVHMVYMGTKLAIHTTLYS